MRNFRQSSDGNNTALHLHEPLSLPTSVLRETLVQELPTRYCTNLDSNMQIRADVDSSLQGRINRRLSTHLVHPERLDMQFRMSRMSELACVLQLVEVPDQCLLIVHRRWGPTNSV